MTILFGGTGVQPTLRGQPTNVISLAGGSSQLVPPGAWQITTGLYTVLQELDAITGLWRAIGSGGDGGATNMVNSDGNNWRLANQSGCIVGGIVTTAGAGYTSAPTVTASQGGAKITAIIGGAVNTTVTVTNAGTNYTYPPIIRFDAPNISGGTGLGVQATGHATLSGSTLGSIVVDDQGAGYTSVPSVYVTNDPREGLNGTTVGSGATATATLTGSGTVTALIVQDFGSSYTSTAIPTLSFSGTSTAGAAATAIMNWSILSYSTTSVGLGYSVAPLVTDNGISGFTATAGSTTNPTITSKLLRQRKAWINAPLASGAVTTAAQTVYDGGVYPGVPTLIALGFASGSAALLTPTMGPVQDTNLLLPI